MALGAVLERSDSVKVIIEGRIRSWHQRSVES
jgi:hypothetical protein